VTNRLGDLRALIRRRITDDVRYELRKNKKKPTPERIGVMLQTGLQDGFIDLLRDYRYQFQKRLQEALERIGREFGEFALELQVEQESAKAFFAQHFDKLLMTGSHALLAEQVNSAIAKASKKHLEALDQEMDQLLMQTMQTMEVAFAQRAARINQTLIDDFEQRCSEPLLQITAEATAKEKILEEAMVQATRSTYDTEMRLGRLSQGISRLQEIAALLEKEGL